MDHGSRSLKGLVGGGAGSGTLNPKARMSTPVVVAHRGIYDGEPENTLRAFRAAVEAGVEFIECDCHLTADGCVAIIHDSTLERTTNGVGEVASWTMEELAGLDAGDGEGVPALEQVLEVIDSKCQLLLEVKTNRQDKVYPGLPEAILEVLTAAGALERTVIQSFAKPYLKTMRSLSPEVRLGLLVMPWRMLLNYRYVEDVEDLGLELVVPHFIRTSRTLTEDLHDRGLKVFCWTVDNTGNLRDVTEAGADGVITNRTKVATEFLHTA